MLNDLQQNLVLILSVLALLGYVVKLTGYVIKQSSEAAQMKFQVSELWKVIFADAQVELVRKGLAKVSSPIHIVSEGFEFIRPYLGLYYPIYERVKRNAIGLNDGEVERRLFQTFGSEARDSIIKNVCLPHNLQFGAGVMAVIQACE